MHLNAPILSSCSTCLFVEKELQSIECDKDVQCLGKLMQRLSGSYISQVLNQESDKTSDILLGDLAGN